MASINILVGDNALLKFRLGTSIVIVLLNLELIVGHGQLFKTHHFVVVRVDDILGTRNHFYIVFHDM